MSQNQRTLNRMSWLEPLNSKIGNLALSTTLMYPHSEDEKIDSQRNSIETGLSPDAENSGGMGRHLDLASTTLLIIGRIIGTGIFSAPGSIAASVGSVGGVLLLWTLGSVLSFAGLFVWLELGCMFPRSGGEKIYLEAAYTKPKLLATTIFSSYAVALGFTASGCIIFASNILNAAGHAVTAWNQRGIAIAVILVVTIIHTVIPKPAVQIMNALCTIKLLSLLFIIITGFVVLAGGAPRVPHPHASFHHPFANSSVSGSAYAAALFKILNSYQGWNNASYVLNEVKSPIRTLKIAGPLALAICSIFYLLANIAYFAAVSPQELAASGNKAAALFVSKVFGRHAEIATSVFVALSALGNVLAITFAQSRVNQELAKEGALPFSRFWAANWKNGAPAAGLLLHLIPSLIVIIAIPAGDAYNLILDVQGYPLALINVFVVIGLFVLRYKLPELKMEFRPWNTVPMLFLAAQVFLLVAPFLKPAGGKGDTGLPYWLYPIVGLAVLVAGAAYWALWRKVWPWLGKFKWVQGKAVLNDGTAVVEWEKERSD